VPNVTPAAWPGLTNDERARLKQLEREKFKLRRATGF
jgi:hypothetical protein